MNHFRKIMFSFLKKYPIILLIGCNEDVCELINQDVATDRGELEENILGMGTIGNCSPERLFLDPSWTQEEQETIRSAAKEWKGTIGIDLGELPVNDLCIWDPYTKGVENCILRADRLYFKDIINNGIILYHDTILESVASCNSENYIEKLRAVALHEMGHWIGLHHLNDNNAVMFKYLRITPITNNDIRFYENTCLVKGNE